MENEKIRNSRRTRRGLFRRRRSTAVWIVAFLTVAILFGLTLYYLSIPIRLANETARMTSIGTYVLKLNGAIAPSFAAALIAISDGLFQRESLSIQVHPRADDADVTSAVAGDDHFIGLAPAQGLLKARTEGLPIVAFAASNTASTVEVFCSF